MIPGFMMIAGNPVTPGSITFSIPGTYIWPVPNFNILTANVSAAGGGGADSNLTANNGGNSSFNVTLLAIGGVGATWDGHVESAGANGTASGGSTNTIGGGAVGGGPGFANNGGNGGFCQKIYHPGNLSSTTQIIVGLGGSSHELHGPDGANGIVIVSWT